jgi:Phytanoyl-CoA dioxygenase (PhyH)
MICVTDIHISAHVNRLSWLSCLSLLTCSQWEVRVYGDMTFVKSGGSTESPVHQDRAASFVDHGFPMISAWLTLTYNVTPTLGAMDYLPRSHLFGKVGYTFSFMLITRIYSFLRVLIVELFCTLYGDVDWGRVSVYGSVCSRV